jgi:ATP adenylyltransferase
MLMSDPAQAAEQLPDAFHAACVACGMALTDSMLPPYNLLVGRHWLLLVPRSLEHWDGGTDKISMNAMSFAGSLFVRRQEQIEAVKQAGPMALLNAVTYPV